MSRTGAKQDPLAIPASFVEERGCLENMLMRIPVVGWIACQFIEDARFATPRKEIAEQMSKRTRQDSIAVWGDDPKRAAFALFVCSSIKANFGWPNDYFVSEDPVKVLFFAESGEGVQVVCEIEKRLGIPEGSITSDELDTLVQMTLGEFVDYFVERYL